MMMTRFDPLARTTAIFIAGALASGCVPAASRVAPAAKAAPSDLDRIGYAVGPCRGSCPVYSFTIAADGIAFFEGKRNTKVIGRVPVAGGPALFQQLKASLMPLRPGAADRIISHEQCIAYSTDQQTVTVEWGWGSDEARTLSFDLGCHEESYASIRKALWDVRRLLPVDKLVGRTTEF